jgi:hypothetical protein
VNERPIEELELGLVELFETLDLEAFAELFALADLLGTSAAGFGADPPGEFVSGAVPQQAQVSVRPRRARAHPCCGVCCGKVRHVLTHACWPRGHVLAGN